MNWRQNQDSRLYPREPPGKKRYLFSQSKQKLMTPPKVFSGHAVPQELRASPRQLG